MKAESVTAEAGYLGNLTTDQEKKLQQLWNLLLGAFNFDAAKQEQAPPSPQDSAEARSDAQQQGNGASAAPPGHEVERSVGQKLADELREAWLNMLKQENPDALLLRFLRARKWDVAQAFSMLNAAIIWRCREARVDEEVLPKGESLCAKREKSSSGKEQKEAHDFLEQLRMGKAYIHGKDRCGRPIGYVNVQLHKPGAQTPETLEKLIVQTIETVRCLCTPPNETFCIIFDLTGFSLSNMEWQPVKYIIRAFEANYPECLGSLLIHNAPWIFSGIWKIIRGLLDPIVAAKVDFTRNATDMEKYISRENILSSLGGSDKWRYQYHEPSEDEDAALAQADVREKIMAERREVADRFLAATQAWIKHLDAGERKEAAIQEQLRRNCVEGLCANYWRLDPYVRSRTNLDRTGVIGPDGLIDLYPERNLNNNTKEVDSREMATDQGDNVVAIHQKVAVAG